jgi:hypothetical protein
MLMMTILIMLMMMMILMMIIADDDDDDDVDDVICSSSSSTLFCSLFYSVNVRILNISLILHFFLIELSQIFRPIETQPVKSSIGDVLAKVPIITFLCGLILFFFDGLQVRNRAQFV